jgi:hypothetical protein
MNDVYQLDFSYELFDNYLTVSRVFGLEEGGLYWIPSKATIWTFFGDF